MAGDGDTALDSTIAPHATSAAEVELATPQTLSDGRARYVLGSEIARGGMGRVVAAHDRLLDRPVALKLMRVNDPELARRFLRERVITARLQHPAIVPIYDAGMLGDDEPFLAMRMVSGTTLDAAAARATSFEDRMRLLPAVIAVADAVAYAHGKGVIHRDLKPQNVLVGEFGEVVVLDWGIALVKGDRATGEVAGTFAYMAPEQASGEHVDERTDVFGLGAILYQVMTGNVPSADRTALATAALPPELASIIARATAEIPGERYASARDFAEDLKRYQAGRLVRAYGYSQRELMRRWIRKHRTKLLVVGAAAAVGGVVGGVALHQIIDERERAEQQRDLARSARAAADHQRVAAEALLGYMLGDLRERLEKVGRLDVLAGFSRAVLDYQARTPANDDESWLQRSAGAAVAGSVADVTGDFKTAADAYARSVAAAVLASTYEPSLEAVAARCRGYVGLGEAQRALGQTAAAHASYAACEQLASGATDSYMQGYFLASVIGDARIARTSGDLVGASALLDKVLPLAEARAKAATPDSPAAKDLITLRFDRWQLYQYMGRASALDAEASALLAETQARAAVRTDDAEARRQVSGARIAVGYAAEQRGDYPAARTAYRAALADARAVASIEPSNAEWQRDVAVATDALGKAELALGHLDVALPYLRESAEISQRIAAEHPDNVDWQIDVATSRNSLGLALFALDRIDEARAEFRGAAATQEALLERPDLRMRMQRDVGLTYGYIGGLELATHHPTEAAIALRRSLELFRAELAAAETPQNREEVASTLLLLARAETDKDTIRALIADARTVLEPLRATAARDAKLTGLFGEIDRVARTHGK